MAPPTPQRVADWRHLGCVPELCVAKALSQQLCLRFPSIHIPVQPTRGRYLLHIAIPFNIAQLHPISTPSITIPHALCCFVSRHQGIIPRGHCAIVRAAYDSQPPSLKYLLPPHSILSTTSTSRTLYSTSIFPATSILSTMDCFQDFCLFCDRDSPDGPYCSQQCKLADLERGNNSSPSSPTSPTSQGERNWDSPYKLYTFQQQQRTAGYTSSANPSSRPRSSYFMWNPSMEQSTADDRQLTPSSSRTSLSSTSSASSASGGISSQAKQQLQDYFSSFDQARAAKRRSSLR